MRAKKALPILLTSAMLFGSAPSSVPIPNLVSKVEAATVSVPYVKPEIIEPKWVTGNIEGGGGGTIQIESVGFSTERTQHGTLVLEIRRKNFCGGCWENYRLQENVTLPVYLYSEPYQLDGRDDSAERATNTLNTVVDYMNRDSKENYYLRVAFYITNPDNDHTYWLGMMGSNDRNSFYLRAYFYPDVNLVPLSKEQRDQYFKGQSISNDTNGSNNNNNGSNTNKQPIIPTPSVKYIGRLIIKNNNVPMYNLKGKIHRKLKKNEDIRVYGIQKDRYLVGGGYYVLKNSNTSFYLGTIYSKKGDMVIYNSKRKLYKKIKVNQKVKVYSTKNNVYQVGGGYYVLPQSNIVFQR
ncbi:hypothetical protein ACPVTF_05145 [Geobacillus icigianus]|uniref:hypothetical protein n=1 Tax=Geobacillus TaxID=129337 RepID=UPI000785B24C|nr:hypothetical protein [Geobacillus sp. B4113_201601]KYD24419.1 hypothetical protein B4113_2454 [Geobacillus sp. B4113_201601]